MRKTILRLAHIYLLSVCLTASGQLSFAGIYTASRVGYFSATLQIFPDSTYSYKETNHRFIRIKDKGKLVYRDSQYYLKSYRLFSKKKTKFITTGKIKMVKINLYADKIMIPDCDSKLPEYCVYHKQ